MGEKKTTRRQRKNEAGKRGLSSAASCGGFSGRERKKKKKRIYIYIQARAEGTGRAAVSPLPDFTT